MYVREKSWLFLDWTIFFPNLPHFNKWHWYLAPKTWEFSLISPSPSSSSVTLPMHFLKKNPSPKDTSNLFIFSPSPLLPSLSTLRLSLPGLLKQCLDWPPCSHSYTLIIYFLPRIYKDQLNPKIRLCSSLNMIAGCQYHLDENLNSL